MAVEIQPATLEDLMVALRSRRRSDEPEWQLGDRLGITVELAGFRLCAFPDAIRSARLNGELLCVFGTYRETVLTDVGTAWFVGTHLVDAHPIAVLRACRRELARICKEFDYRSVDAWVLAENKISCKWLQWLGFRLEETDTPYVYAKLGE